MREETPSLVALRRTCLRVVLCLAFAATAAPTAALAQARREPPPEALRYFRSGQDHYQQGRYREAAEDLEQALALDPASATLLYNLGRVHELLGDAQEAVDYYRRYRDMLPPEATDEREQVESTITRLQGALLHGEIGQTTPDPTEAPAELRPAYVEVRGVVDLPFWVTLGAGGGLTILGAVLGGFALSAHSDATGLVLTTPDDAARRQSRLDRSRHMALGADLTLGIGAGALIAAGLLYLLRTRTLEVLPGATADRHGGTLTLRFRL